MLRRHEKWCKLRLRLQTILASNFDILNQDNVSLGFGKIVSQGWKKFGSKNRYQSLETVPRFLSQYYQN